MVTPKFDGVRALVQGGRVLSRTLKPIPNKNIQKAFGHLEFCDGELLVGEPTDPMCFRNTTSIVMSHNKPIVGLKFYVFDYFGTPEMGYMYRTLNQLVNVKPELASTLEDLKKYEEDLVKKGWEGIIMRDPYGEYKEGRSTVKEGGLLKYKRFVDAEAEIVGWDYEYTNTNPKELDSLGHHKRNSKKAGMVAIATIGSLQVNYKGMVFSIGSGLDEAESKRLWGIRNKLTGKLVKFKYQAAPGQPRFPIYLGLRDARDV